MTRGRSLSLGLTVLTGFSGLVYEVTWQKVLAVLLGSHSEATAAVLAIFLGGLAVGYSLFGSLTRRRLARAAAKGQPPRLLIFYGLVEGSIGLYALAFPPLFAAARTVSFLIPHGHDGLAFSMDVVLAALLIGPPSVLMGGTIPILTQALSRDLADATRLHALVYAFNTAGAFAGALSAGFWLIPALGLMGTLGAMAVVNLLAGGIFVYIGRRSPEPIPEPRGPMPEAGARREAVPGFALFACVALLCGFAMMTVQTVVIRVGGLAFGASETTFSMVVACFVLCIALGSFAVSAFSDRIPRGLLTANLGALLILLGLLYLLLPDAPYWVYALRMRGGDMTFLEFELWSFAGLLAILVLPAALSGATLPLIFHQLRRDSAELGDVAGRLYSWNTFGSLLGALLGGYALFFWLDLHQVFRVALVAIGLSAVLVAGKLSEGSGPARATIGVATLGAILWSVVALPAWAPERLSAGLFRHRQLRSDTFAGPDVFFTNFFQGVLRFYDDDPTASISVKNLTRKGPVVLALVTNGKSDSGVPGDNPTTGLLALLPALLAEKAERAFVIGYGTGVTAGDFASLDSAKEVIVAEISPGVIEAAPLFDFANGNASQNPKVQIVRGDAYRTLLRSEGQFDAIISEPSNPWVTGVEMLYSREFLEAARDHLAPGGIHAQWFHTYETDAATLELVLRTYASVFDHAALWYSQATDMILIGMLDPELALDVERLEVRMARPDFARAMTLRGFPGLPELLVHELLPDGVVGPVGGEGAIHTLTHPILSHRAARAFYGGGIAEVHRSSDSEISGIGQRQSLLQREMTRRGGAFDDATWVRVAAEACEQPSRECPVLLARWTYELPASEARDTLVAESRWIDAALVERLTRLFGADATDAPVSPDEAGDATLLFGRYYHYAAPFSREALAALWHRCVDTPNRPGACRSRLADAEREVGSLSGD